MLLFLIIILLLILTILVYFFWKMNNNINSMQQSINTIHTISLLTMQNIDEHNQPKPKEHEDTQPKELKKHEEPQMKEHEQTQPKGRDANNLMTLIQPTLDVIFGNLRSRDDMKEDADEIKEDVDDEDADEIKEDVADDEKKEDADEESNELSNLMDEVVSDIDVN